MHVVAAYVAVLAENEWMAERKPPGHPLDAASSLCSESVTISAQWPQTPMSALNLPSSRSGGPGGRIFPGYCSKFGPRSIILALSTSSQVPKSSVLGRGSCWPLLPRGSATMISSLETEKKEGSGNVRHIGCCASSRAVQLCANWPSLFAVAGGRLPPFAGDEIRGFLSETENARPAALRIKTLRFK